MRRINAILLAILAGVVCFTPSSRAQNSGVTLEITARITPTAARPEPVRQFTFYVLTKSYADIAKEIEEGNVVPPKDQFIDGLTVSKELKAWLKAHDTMDLTIPELDKMLTPDDIIHTPEFLLAYQRSNSGGVTQGIPKPKYRDADKTANPDRYAKDMQDYLNSLKKFIQGHPGTVSGVELELSGVNPQRQWAQLHSNHTKLVQKMGPEIAQKKYLAGTIETDLEGHGVLRGIAPGNYWISSLGYDANAGDAHVRWDVPVTLQPGQTFRVELTNLNAADTIAASAQ